MELNIQPPHYWPRKQVRSSVPWYLMVWQKNKTNRMCNKETQWYCKEVIVIFFLTWYCSNNLRKLGKVQSVCMKNSVLALLFTALSRHWIPFTSQEQLPALICNISVSKPIALHQFLLTAGENVNNRQRISDLLEVRLMLISIWKLTFPLPSQAFSSS